MKPVDIESSIGLDRLATLKEVGFAMSFSSQGAFDFNSRACKLPEDIMWLAIVSEMVDSIIN
jgi:hypothetical protein